MSKKIIWLIITAMSIAMIGIAAIQWYWVFYSVQLDERKFDETIIEILIEVRFHLIEDANKHEQTINFINKNNQGLINQSSGLGNINFMFKEKVGKISTLGDSTNQYKLKLEKDPWRKRLMYSEMIYRQSRISERPLHQRISPKKLDKYIKQAFKRRNLDLDVEYGVYDNAKKDFVIINGNYSIPMESKGLSEGVKSSGLYSTEYNIDLFEAEKGTQGQLNLFFPKKESWLWASALPLLISSLFFMIIVLLGFSYTVFIIFRQKKLSMMKSDFINNMTHEFKTPLATISLAADSIANPVILSKSEKVMRFIGIIKQENKRMLNQVEKVLQMALIDKDKINLQYSEVDVHQIIQQATENMQLALKEKEGEITCNLDANKFMLIADRTHLSNIVHNLLDNAIKYTPENPAINISTKNSNSGITITVTDNGIGLSNESKKQVFSSFYRVHTGNVHDVKGFGLGLSYVQAMAKAHGGSVAVKSELGKGSSFSVFFPFEHKRELIQ